MSCRLFPEKPLSTQICFLSVGSLKIKQNSNVNTKLAIQKSIRDCIRQNGNTFVSCLKLTNTEKRNWKDMAYVIIYLFNGPPRVTQEIGHWLDKQTQILCVVLFIRKEVMQVISCFAWASYNDICTPYIPSIQGHWVLSRYKDRLSRRMESLLRQEVRKTVLFCLVIAILIRVIEHILYSASR